MIDAEQLSLLPNEPGVYLMKNAQGKVIYVGKAIDIQKRVRSHCRRKDGRYASPFVEDAEMVDVIITDDEVEALLLEYNLIKKYHPPCNVKLKDDKRYPYIKLTDEKYPRAYLTRTVEVDGAAYFGPYPRAGQARQTLNALHEIFPIRSCKHDSDKLLSVRPCLDYEMGRCCAPCGEIVSAEEYQQICLGVTGFLRGHTDLVIQKLTQRMQDCADDLLFEKAGFYRDILEAAEQFARRQKMMSLSVENQDFLGYARVHDIACVAVIRRRGGRVVGSSKHFLDDVKQADTPEILDAFLNQFYARNTDIPKEIYVSNALGIDRVRILEKWLARVAEKLVKILVPQRGAKYDMLQLSEKNARDTAQQQYRRLRGVRQSVPANVIALQESLRLELLPLRIEGYDISNTQGAEAVGAMVVFQNGKAHKSSYRRFKIKNVDQVDDYSMMREMLQRRFQHREENENEKRRFAEPPDLLLIDGGKGHLHAAMEALDEIDVHHFPICSLAKREEEIFLPGVEAPIRLDRRNAGLKLLQQVRDEAHRFGITYHRGLFGKRVKRSTLREIPGVGPARERALLKRFGSLEKIRQTEIEELISLPGVTIDLAQRILEAVRNPSETPAEENEI